MIPAEQDDDAIQGDMHICNTLQHIAYCLWAATQSDPWNKSWVAESFTGPGPISGWSVVDEEDE